MYSTVKDSLGALDEKHFCFWLIIISTPLFKEGNERQVHLFTFEGHLIHLQKKPLGESQVHYIFYRLLKLNYIQSASYTEATVHHIAVIESGFNYSSMNHYSCLQGHVHLLYYCLLSLPQTYSTTTFTY